jgi:putative peptidoglycan lipid II flippase
VNKFFYSFLQKEKFFFFISICPILTPFIIITSIIIFVKNYGIYALAFGAISGSFTEMLFLFLFLFWYKAVPHFAVPTMNTVLRRLINQATIMMIGSALMGVIFLTDRAMAASLGVGAVSALSYGSRVPTLIESLGATAVATAVLPFFSEMVGKKDWNGCIRQLKNYAYGLLFLSIIVSSPLIYTSTEIVVHIFEHGVFTVDDTKLVSGVQQMYLLAIPPYIVGIIAIRMLSALSMNHFLVKIAILNVFCNIFLNYLLMKYLGVAGIALATVIIYINSAVFCFIISVKAIKTKQLNQIERNHATG